MKLSTLILCITCFALVSPLIAQEKPAKPAAAKPAKEKAAKPPALLQAGDPIVIAILAPAEEASKFNSTYTISPEGVIKIPLLETPIKAAGLTHEGLARQLETACRSAGIFKDPSFKVGEPKSGCDFVPHTGTVTGEVKCGDKKVILRDGMTLYQAIMSTGGLAEFADAKRVRLIRGKKETIYDLRKIPPDGGNNPVLKDGDVIHVPQE